MRGEERAHRGGSAHPSGAEPHKRGALHPPTDSDRRERRGGGTGGRGQGARPTSGGGTRQHDCGRSAPSGSEGEEIPARARDARTRWTSGPISERRGAWRPGASHHHKFAPRLWRVERTRGGTQRTPDSQARSEAERAAGWPLSGWGVAKPHEERCERSASDETGRAEQVRGIDSQARSGAERAAGWFEEDVNRLSI